MWYAKQGSMGQGHIVCEETGKSIAIAYDYEHAPLLAAAPGLLAACEITESLLAELADGGAENPELGILRKAIAEAKG